MILKKKNKLFFFAALTLINTLSFCKVYLPNNTNAAAIAQLPKESKIIAWDIHDVLAKSRRWKKAGYALKSIPTFASSLCNLVISKITGRKDPMADVWSDINKLPKKFSSSGEMYYHIFEHHNQPHLAKRVAHVSSLYKPQPGMDAIVQKIHSQGFEQRFASNIGPVFFDQLRDKFKTKYNSTVFDYIQPGKVVDYNNLAQAGKVEASNVTTAKKPSQTFFTDFNSTYNAAGSKQVIFIDDNKKNVMAATKAGWIGIHFENVKQLQADLATLGIAVTA
jgi:hypothetical protein